MQMYLLAGVLLYLNLLAAVSVCEERDERPSVRTVLAGVATFAVAWPLVLAAGAMAGIFCLLVLDAPGTHKKDTAEPDGWGEEE